MNTLYLSLLSIQDGLQLKGWIVTISGFLIVVVALVILYLIFTGVSKIINLDWSKLFKKDKKKDKVEVKEVKNINPDNDDVMVAIGLALSLSMDSVHDVE